MTGLAFVSSVFQAVIISDSDTPHYFEMNLPERQIAHMIRTCLEVERFGIFNFDNPKSLSFLDWY